MKLLKLILRCQDKILRERRRFSQIVREFKPTVISFKHWIPFNRHAAIFDPASTAKVHGSLI
jgi:hypothetical protein